jgi:hypothetical protein
MIGDYPFRVRIAQAGRNKVAGEFDVDHETARLNRFLLEDESIDNGTPAALS